MNLSNAEQHFYIVSNFNQKFGNEQNFKVVNKNFTMLTTFTGTKNNHKQNTSAT